MSTRQAGATQVVPGHVDALDGPIEPEQHHRHQHPALRVWRFLISMRVGLVVMLILGFLTLLGTLFLQASNETRANPEAYKQWLEEGPQSKYGSWTGILDALGIFHVFSTWYFQALFAFLALSIIACTINRVPRLWHAATAPKISVTDAFFHRAPLKTELELPLGVEDATARVTKALKGGHFRVLTREASGQDGARAVDVYGDRFRWGPFGTSLAHLSFVIILAGFVVSGLFGFKDQSFIAPVGQTVPVGHDTALQVTANSFHDAYYDDGRPKDYVSNLTVLDQGQPVATADVRVNTPLRYQGIWFHQAFFGVGSDVKVVKDGKTIAAKMVPLEYSSDDGNASIGKLALPDGTMVYVAQAASGKQVSDLPPGTAGFEVHPAGGKDSDYKTVAQGKSVEILGATYTFERNRQYAGLTISKDPGSPLVWIGSTFLILGSMLVFFFPHRRVWARVRENADGTSHVVMGGVLRRDPGFEHVFTDLVHRLQGTKRPDESGL